VRLGRNPRKVRKEHLAILQAIVNNRPREAEKLVRQHFQLAKEMLEQQVNKGKFAPEWVD
jgi:DNA-binding GntR family transcriptional regulator